MKYRLIAILAAIVTALALVFTFAMPSIAADKVLELTWEDLVPEETFKLLEEFSNNEDAWDDDDFIKRLEDADKITVAKLDGLDVSIPGFMVPLEFDGKNVVEFMVVPQAAACVHVPPPPPNQTILAASQSPIKARDLYQPITVKGRIFAKAETNDLAETGYMLIVDAVEDYVWEQ